MLKEWPGWFDNLCSVQNASYSCHLLGLSVRFLLYSTYILAALPHLQQFIDFGHSVQFPFLHILLHVWVVFCVCCIQCGGIACQNPVISSSKLPYNDIFVKGFGCGFWLPPADNIPPKGITGLHSNTMWYDREYVACHIGEISVIWVCILLLAPAVGYIRYPKCTANCHQIAVVIIEIWINMPPILCSIRRWIQIECGGEE